MGELVRCVRAHGMTRADWVFPRGLDRYGLELLVLATDGIAAVRLAFPDGPVSSLERRARVAARRADLPLPGQPRPPVPARARARDWRDRGFRLAKWTQRPG